MTRVGFEATISAGERPKTYALDRAATGIGCIKELLNDILVYFFILIFIYFNNLSKYKRYFDLLRMWKNWLDSSE